MASSTAFNGMYYFFAVKQEGCDKWTIHNKKFVITLVDGQINGDYLSTMWFTCLLSDEVSYEFMVIAIEVESVDWQLTTIEFHINSHSNYHTIPNVCLYGKLSNKLLQETKVKIANRLDNKPYNNVCVPVHCNLNIGDAHTDELVITIQGAINKTDCKHKIMYTMTLPSFTCTV
jgi:hypothetical protein